MSKTPLVTVVTAVYNAARYLPDLFDSFRSQTFAHESLELIFVNDGSTDESGALCEEFVAQWDGPGRVLSQPNAGQSAARNAGIEVASGEWLSFVDADDLLDADFYHKLTESAAKHAGQGVLAHASMPLTWDEARGVTDNKHPLNFRFRAGDRVVDLAAKPNYSHGHVTTTIYNRAHIEANALRFDERIHIRFEDGNFVARFLLSCDRPLLGLVASTSYRIRVRADGSSTVQNARFDPRCYTEVPRWGYLGVLEYAQQRWGRVPEWAQNLVLYDLLWMMRSSQVEPLRSKVFEDWVHEEFRELLGEVLSYIDVETLRAFDLMRVPSWMPEALALYKEGAPGFSKPLIGVADPHRRLISIRYLHRGEPPVERVSVAGRAAQPRFVKDTQLEFIGRPLVWERTLWVSASGITRLWLDGHLQPLAEHWTRGSITEYKYRTPDIVEDLKEARWKGAPSRFRQWDGNYRSFWRHRLVEWAKRRRGGLSAERFSDWLLAVAIHTPWVWARYKDAWVFMDRDINANDSAEVLYKWVAANHPEVKSYFVIRKNTEDWRRLSAEGVKLIPFGSRRWKYLMLLATHFASSHADRYVTNPLPAARFGLPQWTFTFLQHGIIKGDISGWLNHKAIDVFVTSTEDEYDYVSGPGPFKFGTKEVRLTGLPRHDDLLAQDQAVSPSERRFIMVAPTWRDYLSGSMAEGSGARQAREGFMDSLFARSFAELLASPQLGELVTASGLEIAFMPHPNLEAYLDSFELPDYVKVMRYADYDVRWVIARSVAMVTDYSSIAFNMAYVQRPVVYFQFDRADFYGGGHTERPGYFDYPTHGFGPVVETASEVVAALGQVVEGALDPVYEERMAQTFPVRDFNNSARVFAAMQDSQRRLSRGKATTPADRDTWHTLTSS